jgi:miniconductance mechanosensitive channel
MHAFTKQNQFRSFENIQSEIVEHSLAILNEFGLKVFQVPTGDDVLSLLKTK